MLFDSVMWMTALVCAGPFALLLAAGALVSIWRSNRQRAAKVGWSLVVLVLPLLGPLVWFLTASRWAAAALPRSDAAPANQATGPTAP
ncbi:MAG: PLDc N-terminal domain-containing protein [Actinomycetota bacterium]